MTPEEFYAHAIAVADDEHRLPLSRMTGWEIFPFEPQSLRVVPLQEPALPEPERFGEGGRDCFLCAPDTPAIWTDDHWRLKTLSETGIPLILILEPLAHYDLADLPTDRAREFGVLITTIASAVESLPNIARCHVARWGDGGAHLHVWFIARPAGFVQLRGSCLPIWDDLLPPFPEDERTANANAVVDQLVSSYGGSARL